MAGDRVGGEPSRPYTNAPGRKEADPVNIIPNIAAVQLADGAAEAIRSLNYATMPTGDCLTYSSDVARPRCSADAANLVAGGEG